MKITIAERLHPFSHHIGTSFLIPKTSWSVQVFPTRLFFFDLDGKAEAFSFTFDFQGPIREFTAELNLERAALYIFGKTQKGYMRYELCYREGAVWLTMEKTPQEMVVCRASTSDGVLVLSKGKSISICAAVKGNNATDSKERLSLGNHKAQDWDLMRRRLDCAEIFPHWFVLSNLSLPAERPCGDFPLLNACRKKIEQVEKETVLESFENLFLAAFEGVLVPRLKDSDHQGIAPDLEKCSLAPMDLLRESGKLIRALFVQEKEGVTSLLPCLPTPFHSGRMVQVKTSTNALISLEWSKKVLKKVVIDSAVSGEVRLKFPKGTRSFRLVQSGKTIEVDSAGEALVSVEANKPLHLDRFQKM